MEAKMIQLFRVNTIVKEYSGCKDVPFVWFRNERVRGERPYAELIKDYRPDDEYVCYAEACIEGYFDQQEAEQVKAYLDQNYGHEGVTTIGAVELPIPHDSMGVACLPVGGCNDFYMLDRAEGYSLPFSVWGFYDLRGGQRIDERDACDDPDAKMMDDFARRGAHDDENPYDDCPF
jgi:hypothetical protein